VRVVVWERVRTTTPLLVTRYRAIASVIITIKLFYTLTNRYDDGDDDDVFK